MGWGPETAPRGADLILLSAAAEFLRCSVLDLQHRPTLARWALMCARAKADALALKAKLQ